MKTVSKTGANALDTVSLCGLGMAGWLLLTSVACAAAPDAMNMNQPTVMAPATITPPPAASPSVTSLEPMAPAPMGIAPAASVATSSTLQQIQNAKMNASVTEMTKTFPALEDKATANAQTVMKRLDGSSDAVTLDDLNTARQAVVRLDAMIDVEKHLNELEKIRAEHGTASASHSLASAIPASALTPPPVSKNIEAPIQMAPPPQKRERPSSAARMEVVRISGIGGTYVASLKLEDGTTKPFKIGDHIADHGIIRFISASTVVIDADGETRTLHVKNVDAVYNALR